MSIVRDLAFATKFERVTLSGNTGAEEGGAIYTRSHVELTDVTLSGNSATKGGGLFVTEAGSAEIRDSVH